VFHSLAQAIAALHAARDLGVPVELWSAEGAAAYAGAGWFKAAIEEARDAVPGARAQAVLDCADLPGTALASFRTGVEAVCFTGPPSIARKLADIARQSKCRLLRRRPGRALDLRVVEDPEAACAAWLAPARSPRPKTRAAARRPPRR
jgi:hypothetical protein